MKTTLSLLEYVQEFFQNYLSIQRGVSTNTILSYRDALKLFLEFVCKSKKLTVTRLTLKDLSADAVLAFLKEVESERKNSVITRNLRLAALKTFFSHMISRDVLRAGEYQRIVAIPPKRTAKPLMGYLELNEVQAILNGIDRILENGERDYVLLNLLYNTGMRVQEVCDLRVKDIQLHHPPFVTITGKGNKTRQVPLLPETSNLLETYLTNKSIINNPESKLFLNACGKELGRFGVRYIIQKRAADAAAQCPSLSTKKISPHTFRHTTAMHLLQSGIDLTIIKSWLGHVSLETTHAYLEINLEMKRKALSVCHPIQKSNDLRKILERNKDIISWLESV